jgi:acyl carrier protein
MIEVMIEMWSEVLGGQPVKPDSDFFKLGGDSLMATNLTAMIEERLGCYLDSNEVFENPTPQDLLAHIGSFLGASASAAAGG